METTLRIHTDLLSNSLIENIQKMFPHKEVEISIQETEAGRTKKQLSLNRKQIMSFAGSFSDMSKKDFTDFKKQTTATRSTSFERKFAI